MNFKAIQQTLDEIGNITSPRDKSYHENFRKTFTREKSFTASSQS